MAIWQTRILTSAGLIVTFLVTAIILPIVGCYSTKKEISEFAIKTADDMTGGSAQLPLAEKENEEEENFNKKEQDATTDLFGSSLAFTFISIYTQSFIPQSLSREALKHIPLYLSKRYLLI